MTAWLKFTIALLIVLILPFFLSLNRLPLNVLMILSLVLLELLENQRKFLIALVFTSIVIDIFSGLFVGTSGLFIVLYLKLFELVEQGYLNFIKRIRFFIKISLAIVLYYFYTIILHKIGAIIGVNPDYIIKFDIGLFVSLLFSIFVGFTYAILVKQILKLLVENNEG